MSPQKEHTALICLVVVDQSRTGDTMCSVSGLAVDYKRTTLLASRFQQISETFTYPESLPSVRSR